MATQQFEQSWLECQEKFSKNIESGEIDILPLASWDEAVTLPGVKFTAKYVPGGSNKFESYVHMPLASIKDVLDSTVQQAQHDVAEAVEDAEAGAREARDAAGRVDSAVSAANTAAANANAKATLANDAATSANSAASSATNAASNANSKAALADTAATNANAKATLADNAATSANTAATNANNKATLADNAATNANAKATLADEKATYAKNQGDYAKEQGDYAKDQGDYAKTQGNRAKGYNDHPWSIGSDGYIYVWDETTQAMKKTNKMIIDFSDLTTAQQQAMMQEFFNNLTYATVAESQAAARELT